MVRLPPSRLALRRTIKADTTFKEAVMKLRVLALGTAVMLDGHAFGRPTA
jgi:hypothetical protein